MGRERRVEQMEERRKGRLPVETAFFVGDQAATTLAASTVAVIAATASTPIATASTAAITLAINLQRRRMLFFGGDGFFEDFDVLMSIRGLLLQGF